MPDDAEQSSRKNDGNPFSFKKFLQGGPRRNPNASLPTFDLANDLPDFVQNHHGSGLERLGLDTVTVKQEPLFGVDDEEHESLPEGSTDGGVSRLKHKGAPLASDSDISEEDEDEEKHRVFPMSGLSPGALPDFLSDSAISGGPGIQKAGLGEAGSSPCVTDCAAADLRTVGACVSYVQYNKGRV